jgi:hypothetical protein
MSEPGGDEVTRPSYPSIAQEADNNLQNHYSRSFNLKLIQLEKKEEGNSLFDTNKAGNQTPHD